VAGGLPMGPWKRGGRGQRTKVAAVRMPLYNAGGVPALVVPIGCDNISNLQVVAVRLQRGWLVGG
jgi:hypothetical protein